MSSEDAYLRGVINTKLYPNQDLEKWALFFHKHFMKLNEHEYRCAALHLARRN